jgi:hypothetical protein
MEDETRVNQVRFLYRGIWSIENSNIVDGITENKIIIIKIIRDCHADFLGLKTINVIANIAPEVFSRNKSLQGLYLILINNKMLKIEDNNKINKWVLNFLSMV